MAGSFLCAIGRAFLSLRYRVDLLGVQDISGRGRTGILFLPNHPALIDPPLVISQLWPRFRPRSLADRDQVDLPVVGWILRRMGVRPMMDVAKYGEAARQDAAAALDACIEGLRRGENLVLYPAGHLMRTHLEDLGGNSAVETILSRLPEVRVVLVRTRGVWGSRFSRIDGRQPDLLRGVRTGLLDLLASGLFFMPRRRVTIDLQEPADLPRAAGRHALNRFLEGHYNEGAPLGLGVPRTPWGAGTVEELPDPKVSGVQGDLSDVKPAVREQVLARLREQTGIANVALEQSLARDLGLDSLGRMDLGLWLEQTFGFQGQVEGLQTVGDVCLAAAGLASGEVTELKPVPPAWFQDGATPQLPAGDTVTDVFLAQARRGPGRPVVADQLGGLRTFRDLVTACLVLRPHLAALEGRYLGIMLPASGGAGAIFLAALFAGKIPVMVNWTVGQRALAHSLDLLGVRHVVTARALLQKLKGQGVSLGELENRFFALEDLGARLGTGEKLLAFAKARMGFWGSLKGRTGQGTAVVLFTSGSESLPKAVPLTHENLLTNLRDLLQVFTFGPQDRLLGMLPPFHSFGLTCTTLLPLLSGLPAAYHPNPTEGRQLAALIAAYRVTIAAATPTFMNGIQRGATDDQLRTLKIALTGAEKCPEALATTLAQRWPDLEILEGYGITECSPVVSVHRPGAGRTGTIGQVLPSLTAVRVDPETGHQVEGDRAGMLLLRGPSIFGGYLEYDGPSPFETFDGHSWYRTGDLVKEVDGHLVFAGRLKRFVKVAGEMVSLPAIEEALVARFGTPEDEGPILAVEAATPETDPELVLFTVRELDRESANQAIRAAGLSPIHHVRQVRLLEALPLLGTGKTDYRALKTLLAEGAGNPLRGSGYHV